jgi:hypothetical protein
LRVQLKSAAVTNMETNFRCAEALSEARRREKITIVSVSLEKDLRLIERETDFARQMCQMRYQRKMNTAEVGGGDDLAKDRMRFF